MSKVNPSAGVTRAAKALHLAGYTSFAGESAEVRIAEIIDRETNHTKLLASAREVCRAKVGYGSNLTQADFLLLERLDDAVRKAIVTKGADTNSPEVRRARGSM